MSIAFAELLASLGALALLSLIIAPAGAGIAGFLRFPGFVDASPLERAGLGLICGFGCLPILLDYAGRSGPRAMSAFALALAAMGAPSLLPFRSANRLRLHPGWIAVALLWVVLALSLVVDMPVGGLLGRSLLAVDYVKHASATWSLAEAGAPPWNPAFYEPGRTMSYYYLFYTLPAVGTVLGAPFGVSARHAAYACAPLIGFALFALGVATLVRSRASETLAGATVRPHDANGWLLALLFATGLDFIVLAILFSAAHGDAYQVVEKFAGWDDQITSWFNSVMWVPHHVAGLCAALVGFISLTAAKQDWRRVALAGVAFASMAGMSVYVAGTAALGAFIWLATLLSRRHLAEATRLCVAGVFAVVLAAPWLFTLAGRLGGGEPPPIGFRLRGPEWIDFVAGSPDAGALYRGLSMPLFYLVHFGVFALGALVFWRKAGRRGYANELGLVLLCLTAASFLVGSFWRSTILDNDLGWRSMLFAQFAMLVWTAAAARHGAMFQRSSRPLAIACLTVGFAGSAAAAAQLRFSTPSLIESTTLADEMAAWSWLTAHLSQRAVAQARPEEKRAYGYGLYGRFPVALADRHNGRLFGAHPSEISARFDKIAPIFSDASLSYDDARRRAAEFGIAAFVVSSRDAIFAAPGAWPASVEADYANPNFRVYLLEKSGS